MNLEEGLTQLDFAVMADWTAPEWLGELGVRPALRSDLHLPLAYNDGTPIEPALLRQHVGEVFACSPGMTITPPGQGCWLDEAGNFYLDPILMVNVVTTRPDAMAWFEDWAVRGQRLFKQEEKLYVYHQRVWLVESTTAVPAIPQTSAEGPLIAPVVKPAG